MGHPHPPPSPLPFPPLNALEKNNNNNYLPLSSHPHPPPSPLPFPPLNALEKKNILNFLFLNTYFCHLKEASASLPTTISSSSLSSSVSPVKRPEKKKNILKFLFLNKYLPLSSQRGFCFFADNYLILLPLLFRFPC